MKRIVLFICPFVEKKERPEYEKEVKRKVLREDLKISLKFVYPETNEFILNIWLLIKKEKLKIVVFHKCHASTITDHHKALSKKEGAGGMFFFHNDTYGVLDEQLRNKVVQLNTLKFLPSQLATMVG